ncbi:MAG: hypothetical protein SFU83_01820 [Meiothermus sp.]|nr:hypothetical protein [Meiothermus sp.]
MNTRLRPLFVALAVSAVALIAGCAPSAGRPLALPFALGDTLQFYAMGANISDGNRQTIKVITRLERAAGDDYFYAIGSADEKTTFLYYYPGENMVGVYLFLSKGREATSGDAVICIAESDAQGWTGGWTQTTLSGFRKMIQDETLRPEGICTVQKR